jgi:protein arginine kinase activator
MLCECCQEQDASIHVTQVVNGESREVHLCESCAEEHGLNVQGAMSVPELLFGMTQGRTDAAAPSKACPHCHLRQTDYKKRGRLGCPACYETFAEELAPMLASMHHAVEHKGKVPKRHPAAAAAAGPAAAPDAAPAHGAAAPAPGSEREDLLRQMEIALKAEDYETAAKLRDRLKELGA